MRAAAPSGSAVPARTRLAVYAFLLVFLVCGVATFEVYPFSGFRLFSELRGEERTSWSLRAVDAEGAEHAIVLGELPLPYRKTTLLIDGWEDRDPAERDAICLAWSDPLRDEGIDVIEVRVYRVVASVRPGAPPPERTLAYTCGRVG